jgi:replicative DNA helicase
MTERRKQLPQNTVASVGLDHGKVPPQALDFEQAVLGALMLEPNAIYEIADIFNPEAFYKDNYQKIAQAVLDLFQADKKIDLLTVTNQLREKKQLEEIGGPVYITQLAMRIASASHIVEHYQIVKQKHIARELIRVSGEIMQSAFDESQDIDDLLDFANNEIGGVNDKAIGNKQSSHISVVVEKSKAALRKREDAVKRGKLSGIKTPLHELDKYTQGWQPDVIVLAARPSQGKSAFALAIAKKAAMEGIPVCFYSLEMSDISLGNRLILSEADVDVDKFRSGYVKETDWSGINKAAETLKKLPIYIDDNPCVGLTYIKSHARQMNKKGMCGIIILDYLQLTEIDSHVKGSTRDIDIGNLMRGFVKLKKQLNIPIIVLSQLNRAVEKYGEKRPSLSNLRESGAIEQDADVVLFIHKPWSYGIKEDSNGNTWKDNALIIIAKQREGPLEDVRFSHNPEMTKIKDYVNPNAFQMKSADVVNKPPDAEQGIMDLPDKDDMPF